MMADLYAETQDPDALAIMDTVEKEIWSSVKDLEKHGKKMKRNAFVEIRAYNELTDLYGYMRESQKSMEAATSVLKSYRDGIRQIRKIKRLR